MSKWSGAVPQCAARLSAVFLATALLLAACGSSTTPTAPSGASPSDVLVLEVECQPTMYIGEQHPCIAVARLRSGGTPLVSPLATWSSTRPEVAVVNTIGLVTGRGTGQTTVRAEYQGRSAQVSVSVVAEDALRVTAALDQGLFRPGTIVTMYLQGYYSVASAETARLSLRISDQRGTVTQSAPVSVSRGGDFFLLSTTFTVPNESTQLCRAAVLEVSGRIISAPEPGSSNLACVAVRP
jgi:hypothetical protein